MIGLKDGAESGTVMIGQKSEGLSVGGGRGVSRNLYSFTVPDKSFGSEWLEGEAWALIYYAKDISKTNMQLPRSPRLLLTFGMYPVNSM
jgi:hypothetical protein